MSSLTTVSGTFEDVHAVIEAVRAVREAGARDVRVHGPVMEPELEAALGKPASPVRRYALLGGIAGGITGFALTIWSSYYYPLVAGGKPLASIPAYVVIGFELTILFAGISALIGMLIHNRMPTMKLGPAHDPAFTDDTFAVRARCERARSDAVAAALRSHGGREVSVES